MTSAVITTGVGLLTGLIKNIFDQMFKLNAQAIEATQKFNDREVADRQAAREADKPEWQFTKRTIVLSMCFAFFWAPCILTFFYPEVTLEIPVWSTAGGIWGMIVGTKEKVSYINVTGFAYVASLIDLFGLVVGYYFGSGGSRK